MKRWNVFIAILGLLTGCSGAAQGLIPNGNYHSVPDRSAGAAKAQVTLQLTIPRRRRQARALRPSTISPSTRSVTIAVDGGAAKAFNATPQSPGCTIGSAGSTTCRFGIATSPGTHVILVKTFDAANAAGTVLDEGSATVNVAIGKANSATIVLGPVVTNAADSGPGSLRYAIGSANRGDTILFLIAKGSTIVLKSTLNLKTSLSIAGPGVTKSGGTYSGIVISGAHTQQLFAVYNGVTASISGLILTQGNAIGASTPGGAVFNQGTLTLAGDALTHNTSVGFSPYARRTPGHHLHPHSCSNTYHEGGAVYNNGTLAITDSTFDSNSVTSNVYPTGTNCQYGYGGGLYNDEYGVLTVGGSTFVNNGAYAGGAVYNASLFAQASFTNDTFSNNVGCTADNGCPTTGCTGSGCTSYPGGFGAAIFDSKGPGIVITGSTFSGNVDGGTGTSTSAGVGAALFLNAGTPVVTGSTFTGNRAGGGTSNCSLGTGGAIYATVPLEIDNDTFSGNHAGGDFGGSGAAVYGTNAISGTGDTFENNAAYASVSACAPTPAAGGGAIYSTSAVNVDKSTFIGNTATGVLNAYGGAVYENAPSAFTGDSFSRNVAFANGAGGAPATAYGGAVDANGAVRLNGDTFTSNAAEIGGSSGASSEGGAVYGAAAVTSSGNTFSSNAAKQTGPASALSEGGALLAFASLSSDRDTFASNAATALSVEEGGAVYVNGKFTIANGTFASNKASGNTAEGGGLYVYNSGFVTNDTFKSNVASGSQYGEGGAVFDIGGAVISGSALTGNTASSAGGGLYAEVADGVNYSTISLNKVTAAPPYNGGGGIYAAQPVTMQYSTISHNAVALAPSAGAAGGGGIYNYNGLYAYNSLIFGNSVTGSGAFSGGGGIFIFATTAIIESTIDGNSSTIDGGGLQTYGNYGVSAWGDTIYENKATGKGGNIYNAFSTTNLTFDIVAGGSANSGPDINNTGGSMSSGGYNIVQTAIVGNALTGTTTGNRQADPKLLPLANNGGPTLTNADTPTSPGTNAIPVVTTYCDSLFIPMYDQRGFTRGTNGHCDVGAYEYNGVATAGRVRPPPLHRPHSYRGPHGSPQHRSLHPLPQRVAPITLPLGLP